MIKEILKKITSRYLKYKRIYITTSKKRSKTSDIERWSQSDSLFSDWNERTQLLANQIQSHSKVLEFGSAKLVLKSMLPNGCEYYNSDIVSRDEDTMVVDLNKELPQFPVVDYIVFSGVLEYLFEVGNILKHLSQFTDNFVFSYATTNAYSDISNRRLNGWVSDLSENEIERLAEELEMRFEIIGSWRKQTLYQFSK